MASLRIPLFPLDVVLLPKKPLPLHIFEPRYKLMIGNAVEQDAPFGVVRGLQGADGHFVRAAGGRIARAACGANRQKLMTMVEWTLPPLARGFSGFERFTMKIISRGDCRH